MSEIQCPIPCSFRVRKTAVTVVAKSAFIVQVKQDDDHAKAVLYTRVGIVDTSLALAYFFW